MLKAAGWTGAVASTMLGGCLGAADEIDYRWKYGVGGDLDTVSEGTVFARERSERESSDDGKFFDTGSEDGPAADGQVVALDAETGDLQWTYGETGRQDGYTEVTVADGVYFSYCDDDDCERLSALDIDGEERWEANVGASRHRPVVADDVVYNTSDNGIVWAVDAETGGKRWPRLVPGPDGDASRSASIVAVADAVYVETDAAVVALDRTGGIVRWRYEIDGDRPILDTVVSNGVVYLVTTDRIVAVADGDESWHRRFDAGEVAVETEIAGVTADHLFVLVGIDDREYRLSAFDRTTGERRWQSDSLESADAELDPRAVVHDGAVYLGAERLRALEAATGDERWNASVDGAPIRSITVVEENVTSDHGVFVHADEPRLTGFTPDGEQLWTDSVDGAIRDYLVADSVYVATDEAIYALER